ncbi:hypothetical protein N9L02_02440, partial [Gammaproteobacteria bacterium]|nr:hypothetical protein [Gammaproteobacteria bacterium]
MYQNNKYIFFAVIILYCINIFALDDDNKKPMKILANKTLFNYKTGKDIYEGNVQVTQGSTTLLADKLITERDENHKIKIATA